MPLEYCLLLTDNIDDLETLAEFRSFVAEETGIDLTIEA